jgi:hypothetical protein
MTDLIDALPGILAQLPDNLRDSPANDLGVGDGFANLVGLVRYAAYAVLLIATIGAGAMMAVSSRRGEGSEHLSRIGWVFGGAIVVAGAASLVDAFI